MGVSNDWRWFWPLLRASSLGHGITAPPSSGRQAAKDTITTITTTTSSALTHRPGPRLLLQLFRPASYSWTQAGISRWSMGMNSESS